MFGCDLGRIYDRQGLLSQLIKREKMKLQGKCKALRIYVDEDIKWQSRLLYRAIVEKLLSLGIAGATVFKGIEGYGSSARIHSARVIEIMENLPVMIEAVDISQKIQKALKAVEPMLPAQCLVTVQDIQVIHYRAPEKKSTKTKKFS
jgi:PII-like signaling protein